MNGVSLRLVKFRLGGVDVDLLSGWLCSRGELPCVGVTVGGVELHLEACVRDDGDDGRAKGGDGFLRSRVY